MNNNAKKIQMLSMGVVLCFGIFLVLTSCGKNPDTMKKIVQPVRGDIKSYVSTTGEVQPQNRLEIKPPIAGRIEEILVEEGQIVKTGDVLALMSSTERAALLDGARLQGEQELEYWKTVYNQTPLIAPIDGLVIVRSVEPGQTVTTNDVIIVLSDRLIVEADVDETDIGGVALGQKAVVSLDAYPDIEVSASVSHISYESELVNNVSIYKVDIMPDTVPDVFRSGMSADVDIVVKEKSGVLLLPFEAVKNKAGQNTVTVLTQSSHEEKTVLVQTGLEDEANIEILTGLAETDHVVIKQQDFQSLKDGIGRNPFMPFKNKDKNKKNMMK